MRHIMLHFYVTLLLLPIVMHAGGACSLQCFKGPARRQQVSALQREEYIEQVQQTRMPALYLLPPTSRQRAMGSGAAVHTAHIIVFVRRS